MKGLMVLLGAVVGGAIGYLTRPSLPLVGQPDLRAVIASLNSPAQWERNFAQQSVIYLFVALVVGGAVGLIAALIASKINAGPRNVGTS